MTTSVVRHTALPRYTSSFFPEFAQPPLEAYLKEFSAFPPSVSIKLQPGRVGRGSSIWRHILTRSMSGGPPGRWLISRRLVCRRLLSRIGFLALLLRDGP